MQQCKAVLRSEYFSRCENIIFSMPNIFTIVADFHAVTTKIIDGVKNSDTDKQTTWSILPILFLNERLIRTEVMKPDHRIM